MSINTASDYFAAVEERQHIEALLHRGREKFSGYGLELFERGLGAKIEKLTSEIKSYEVQLGYPTTWDLESNGILVFNVPMDTKLLSQSAFEEIATFNLISVDVNTDVNTTCEQENLYLDADGLFFAYTPQNAGVRMVTASRSDVKDIFYRKTGCVRPLLPQLLCAPST